ncbi:hypothetical protein HYT18_05040 [Candidatus Microgenomates bacterium]|nr:hypothetical protein [Candidatus Microgenomates bacterium]
MQLGDVRDVIVRQTGKQPSRLMISSVAIENSVIRPLEDSAQEYFAHGDYATYVFGSDFAHGINMVRVSLVLAEEYVREYAEEVIKRARQEREGYLGEGIPIAEAAEGYLVMQREAGEAAGLLLKDPSGLTLARAAMEWVKQPPRPGRIERIFPPNRIREYVHAGAEVGLLVYGTMYDVTGDLAK